MRFRIGFGKPTGENDEILFSKALAAGARLERPGKSGAEGIDFRGRPQGGFEALEGIKKKTKIKGGSCSNKFDQSRDLRMGFPAKLKVTEGPGSLLLDLWVAPGVIQKLSLIHI